MAYVSNSLHLVVNPVGGAFARVFMYDDASVGSSDATIVGAGWFSDGVSQGMRIGDLVDVVWRGTPKYKRYQVLSVSGAAATVQTPAAIT